MEVKKCVQRWNRHPRPGNLPAPRKLLSSRRYKDRRHASSMEITPRELWMCNENGVESWMGQTGKQREEEQIASQQASDVVMTLY